MLLAMALNPAVDWLQTRGVRRGAAVAIVIVSATLIIVGIAALFVPTLVREVNDFADALPGYVDDLTKGRGRLGFLERDYQIVEKVRAAIEKSGVSGALRFSNTARRDEERHQRGSRGAVDLVLDAVHAARGAGLD